MYSSEHALECNLIVYLGKWNQYSVAINGMIYWFYTGYVTPV
jgi:hypothetical protein